MDTRAKGAFALINGSKGSKDDVAHATSYAAATEAANSNSAELGRQLSTLLTY